MAQLPDVSKDISLLTRFIRAVEDLPTAPSAQLENAQSHASNLLHRLQTPIRIAVTGMTGAGKSSLVNLLLGEVLAPMDSEGVLPALLFEHSDEDVTTVGWWDRPSKEAKGHVIKAALKEQPDLISVGVDCPILKSLQLIDVSGLDQPGHDKDAVLALTQLADVLIWCTKASIQMDEEQLKLVKLLPNRLTKNSLLVLTHADDIPLETRQKTAIELEARGNTGFRFVSHIATLQAWAAFHGEGDDPGALWTQSGAPDMLAHLMDVAVSARRKEVGKIQRGIAKQVVPFLTEVPLPPEETPPPEPIAPPAEDTEPEVSVAPEPAPRAPEPVAPVAAPDPSPEPAPEPADEPLAPAANLSDDDVDDDYDPMPDLVRSPTPVHGTDAVFAAWIAQLEELQGKTGDMAANEEFVQAAQELVSDFLDELADEESLEDAHDWVMAEFEKANDLMVLLQFESGDRTAVDAALILAQLTDSLSYV